MKRGPALLLLLALVGTCCSLAPIDLSRQKPLALRTTVVASDGTFLARLYKQNRSLASYDEFPTSLIDAVIAAEDARFFEHSGFDIRSILRAAVINVSHGEVVQGGSTITQQYVKNTFFRHPGRTFHRKARELRLAIEVERRYTKKEILNLYLNTVYLGQGAYGVKAAAETYFNVPLESLTLEQGALLAGLIKAPSLYDPRDHPRRAKARRRYVLGRMEILGMITAEQAKAARRAPLGVIERTPRLPTRQPYFVEAVKRELLRDKRLGQTDQERARALWQGGLHVRTTLVPRLQTAAEDAVASILNQPGDPEAALVAIRPQTGEIVAMVGGRSWKTSQVNLALGTEGGGSGRQPGSSFKPLVLATALENGISLVSRYEASPAIFTLPDGSTWTVHNSEGTSGGTLPLNEALVRSVNGVFARLAIQLGASQIVTQAKLMGVRSKLPNYPSIALGSADVSVLDMAAAYATIANHGTAIEPTTVKEIRTGEGEILHADQKIVRGAISPGNAFLLTKVMEQVILRGTGTAAKIGRPAAGKTGTTNDYTDAWFVGFTPQLATAVWVGYPQGLIPMTSVHGIRVFGGTFPAQIWKAFMSVAMQGKAVERFALPEEALVTVMIDPVSGLLAAPWCPGEPKRMLRELAPHQYCPVPPPVVVPIYSPPATPLATPTSTESPRPRPSETVKSGRPPSPRPSNETEPAPTPTGGDAEGGDG